MNSDTRYCKVTWQWGGGAPSIFIITALVNVPNKIVMLRVVTRYSHCSVGFIWN